MNLSSSRQLPGVLLSIATAFSFACSTALAAFTYGYGASPLSLLTYRCGFGAVSLLILLSLMQVQLRLPPRRRWAAMGLGLLLGSASFGLISALQRIPLAVAVLTFYLNPLLVGIIAWATGRERMTPILALSLVTAFCGLALVLGVGAGGLDPVGVGLALAGACLSATMITLAGRLVGGGDSRPVSLHMLTAATAAFLVADLIVGAYPVPEPGPGLIAFVASGLFFAFAIIGMMIAISWIGPVRTALIQNLEPVTSVVLGVVALGQPMGAWQWLGAALVIAAIVMPAWKKAAPAAN